VGALQPYDSNQGEERVRNQRWLDWPALLNARDLGGLPVGAGVTPFGAIIRSDGLDRLTGPGLEAMQAYGVATIIDLRAPRERATWPNQARHLPGYRGLELADDRSLEWVTGRFNHDRKGWYVWYLEARASRVAAVLRAIADAPRGGVVVHCAIGKDRTGIIVTLLLALAGVEWEAIVADYLLSAEGLESLVEEEPDPSKRAQLRRWFKPDPELVVELLTHVHERYGGVDGYLRSVGLHDGERMRLRQRLVSR
jgi:protein-tyrosine phosphatase